MFISTLALPVYNLVLILGLLILSSIVHGPSRPWLFTNPHHTAPFLPVGRGGMLIGLGVQCVVHALTPGQSGGHLLYVSRSGPFYCPLPLWASVEY